MGSSQRKAKGPLHAKGQMSSTQSRWGNMRAAECMTAWAWVGSPFHFHLIIPSQLQTCIAGMAAMCLVFSDIMSSFLLGCHVEHDATMQSARESERESEGRRWQQGKVHQERVSLFLSLGSCEDVHFELWQQREIVVGWYSALHFGLPLTGGGAFASYNS